MKKKRKVSAVGWIEGNRLFAFSKGGPERTNPRFWSPIVYAFKRDARAESIVGCVNAPVKVRLTMEEI